MIRFGMGIIALGIAAVLLPFGSALALVGFVLIGLGCAPIFPGMLHETPVRFGASLLYCQHAVQQQHALFRPAFQKAMAGRRDAQIVVQFAEDVAKRRRHRHAGRH